MNKKPIEPEPAVENVITQLNSEATDSYITKETHPVLAGGKLLLFCLRKEGFVDSPDICFPTGMLRKSHPGK